MRAIIVLLVAGVGCGRLAGADEVNSVRVLAISADQPYAAPGATVTMQALIVDGRADRAPPMTVAWIPSACVDPKNDLYYACYPGFDRYPTGTDLSSSLAMGPTFSFTLPDDLITAHAGDASFGVAYAFVIACAGHIERLAGSSTASANALPFGCFDDAGTALDPSDYELAFAPVYAFADGRTNASPVIDHLELAGAPVDPVAGITAPRCADASHCPTLAVDTILTPASWELDPADHDENGAELHEELSVDYFTTGGQFDRPDERLYDPRVGALHNTDDKLTAPTTSGDYQLWAVAHDNRGGTSWLQVPLHIK